MVRGGGAGFHVIPAFQADATMAQAAPVQNTYYTILDTTLNVEVYGIGISVADTGENLQIKITVDGNTWETNEVVAVAGTWYFFYKPVASNQGTPYANAAFPYSWAPMPLNNPLRARSVKVEVRKTTATGAGVLSGRIVYAKY